MKRWTSAAMMVGLLLASVKRVEAESWWMLMRPRIVQDYGPYGDELQIYLDEDRPIKEWEHVRNFNTAKECQDYRRKLWDEIRGYSAPERAQVSASRCVLARTEGRK